MEDLIWKIQDALGAKDKLKDLKELMEIHPNPETEGDLEELERELPGIIAEGFKACDDIKDLLLRQNTDVMDRVDLLVKPKEVSNGENLDNVDTESKSKVLKDAKAFVKKGLGINAKARRTKEDIASYWDAVTKDLDWSKITSVPELLRAVGDERGWRIKRGDANNRGGSAKDIMGKFEYKLCQLLLKTNRGW